jgi:hypothetical protein
MTPKITVIVTEAFSLNSADFNQHLINPIAHMYALNQTIVCLTNPAFLDKEIADNGSLEKAKPFVRRGRKAAGPAKGMMVELPKLEPLEAPPFYFWAIKLNIGRWQKSKYY